MHIEIEHINGKYPSFNVALSSQPGKQAFLVVKGCRIVDGPNGQFVSGPATKNATSGKYWNHTYFNDQFSAAVLDKALDQPAPAPAPARKPSHDAARSRQTADRSMPHKDYGNEFADDQIPF